MQFLYKILPKLIKLFRRLIVNIVEDDIFYVFSHRNLKIQHIHEPGDSVHRFE